MTVVYVRTWSLAILIAALAMLGPFSIDAYLPAFHAIGSEFGAESFARNKNRSATGLVRNLSATSVATATRSPPLIVDSLFIANLS